MGQKRVRTPHYINGFGDGEVGDPSEDLQKRGIRQRSHTINDEQQRLAAQKHPWALYLDENAEEQLRGGHLSSSSSSSSSSRTASNNSQWQVAPLTMLLAIVLLSAFFLHVLSDAHQKTQQYNSKFDHRVHRKVAKKTRKKKTDEWNDDYDEHDDSNHEGEEKDLLGESLRSVKSTDGEFPYHHHHHPHQQHRHRKSSTTATNATKTITTPAAATPYGQTTPQQKSYYLNQSGGAVIASSYATPAAATTTSKPMTPSSSRVIRSIVNPNASPHPTNVVKESPSLGGRVVRLGVTNTNTSAMERGEGFASGIGTVTPQPYATPPPPPPQFHYPTRTNMHAQVLSGASSLDSSVPSSSNQGDSTMKFNKPKSGEGIGSPKLSPKDSPNVSFHSETNHLLLSPGTDDPSPHGGGGGHNMMIEQTPRVSNLKTIHQDVPQYYDDAPLPPLNVQQPSFGSVSVSSETFKFASPPDIRNTHHESAVAASRQPPPPNESPPPMLPNLSVHVAQTRPPNSINIDELHLFQMMESGNVSHWEARGADAATKVRQEEAFLHNSRRMVQEAQGRPTTEPDVLGGGSPQDTTDSIPSNDPRKSIHHKRPDLTISTDAASSLQNAIDFSELRLVEVIGGGGFGQVWKAVWRGTPVAVKVLTGSAQSKNVPKAVLEEFVAEINLLKGMRHPNICLYMGACLAPPNRAIITELAANGSLWDALRLPLSQPYRPCDGVSRDFWPLSLYMPDSRHGAPPTGDQRQAPAPRLIPPRGTWPWDLVKRVACGAARGMAYLHSGKPPVLHRDLKVSYRTFSITGLENLDVSLTPLFGFL